MVGIFSGGGAKSSESIPTMPSFTLPHSPVEDHSTFEIDEGEGKKGRKLRKSLSEGGGLHARARQILGNPVATTSAGEQQGGMF